MVENFFETDDELAILDKIKDTKELLDMGAITQEEFDEIKNKYLSKLLKSDEFDANEHTSSNLGDTLADILGDNQQNKVKRAKKSETQKMAEKAVTQASDAAAREVRKGIMKGIFGEMK